MLRVLIESAVTAIVILGSIAVILATLPKRNKVCSIEFKNGSIETDYNCENFYGTTYCNKSDYRDFKKMTCKNQEG